MSIPSHSHSFPSIPGYTLTEMLYEGRQTAVYRGLDNSSHEAVVVKLLQTSYPG